MGKRFSVLSEDTHRLITDQDTLAKAKEFVVETEPDNYFISDTSNGKTYSTPDGGRTWEDEGDDERDGGVVGALQALGNAVKEENAKKGMY